MHLPYMSIYCLKGTGNKDAVKFDSRKSIRVFTLTNRQWPFGRTTTDVKPCESLELQLRKTNSSGQKKELDPLQNLTKIRAF